VDLKSTAMMLENIPHLNSKPKNKKLNKELEEEEIIKAIWGLALC
jgi:hypothetical protein